MSQDLSPFDQLKADIGIFVAPSAAIIVTDRESAQKALESAKVVKNFLNKVEGKREELVSPLNDQVKFINGYAKEIKEPLLKAERHIKAQIVAFEEAQEKERQRKFREEEERKREEERKAAAERARIESEMSAKRQAEEAELASRSESADLFGTDDPEAIEAERKAANARIEREAAEHQARLDREAKQREAEAKQRAYDIESTRLKGAKKNWKCEAIDLSKVPREFLVIKLNDAAVLAAARGGMTDIPGVRLWQETGVAIGATTSLRELAKAE